MEDTIKKEHPSYGLARFSRVQGGNQVMFGSSITHNNFISLEIEHAELNRELSGDWIFGKKSIIEVYFSPTQFAELLTMMNHGSGSPCTIKYMENERIDECPFDSKLETFTEEVDNKTVRLNEMIDKAKNKVEDLKATKKVKDTFYNMLDQINVELKSNLPFVLKQFKRQMNKTVAEAKGEVEAFVEHKIRSTGLEAIKDQMPQIAE